MDNQTISALLIEDDLTYARLVQDEVGGLSPYAIRISWAKNLATGLRMLAETPYDLILLALPPKDAQVSDPFPELRTLVPQMPIIVLVECDNASSMAKFIQQGAQDCLSKTSLDSRLLTRSIYYAVERSHLLAELREQWRELSALEGHQRLARDLQDHVVQTLFSASVTAEGLKRLCDGSNTSFKNEIESLTRLIRDALNKTQGMLHALNADVVRASVASDSLSMPLIDD